MKPDSVAGVALTTQRGTVVVTDDAGRPLRPAIVWLDQRRTEGVPPIGGRHRARVPGARRPRHGRRVPGRGRGELDPGRTSPTTWRAIRHYLLLSGFLAHRLTGRFVDSVASQVGYIPFDYKRLPLGEPAGDWRWQAAPIDPGWLPELVPPTEPLGELTPDAASGRSGCRPGTPVIAAAADKACEVLGSGALEPHIGAISYGTTATINTTQRRYVEAVPLVPPYPAARAGRVLARGPGLPRLLDGRVVQAPVRRAARSELADGARRHAGGAVRRSRPRDAGGLDGPPPPADLVARRPDPGPRGEGRDHRLRRRPHPGPPLSGDPRGTRLRAARGRRAGGEAGEGAAHASCGSPAAAPSRRRPSS